MPYGVRKRGDKHQVYNKKTGKVYGSHESEEKANKQLAALHIHTHESVILKQDVVLESNGVITIIPQDTEIEFTDRYDALGIKRPDPNKMCKGHCEGTGYYPAFNPEFKFPDDGKSHATLVDKTPLEPAILALWQAAEAENPTDDGWHFIECPDCCGKGEIEIANDLYDNTAPSCPVCNNRLMRTRGVGYTHACALPAEQGENHTITVVGNKAVPWDGTKDHYSRLSKLSESKIVSETIMDKAFDSFNDRFPPIAKDGYYEINSPMDDFVVYLVENHGWYINRHRAADPTLPSSGYAWLVHKLYPGSKLVVSNLGNNKIKVEEKKL